MLPPDCSFRRGGERGLRWWASNEKSAIVDGGDIHVVDRPWSFHFVCGIFLSLSGNFMHISLKCVCFQTGLLSLHSMLDVSLMKWMKCVQQYINYVVLLIQCYTNSIILCTRMYGTCRVARARQRINSMTLRFVRFAIEIIVSLVVCLLVAWDAAIAALRELNEFLSGIKSIVNMFDAVCKQH